MIEMDSLEIVRAAKARSQVEVDRKAEVLIVPDPEIPAHVIDWTDNVWPRGARTIGNLATRNGWVVVGSHARGPWIGDVPLRVLRTCDSLLLRMSRGDGLRASALWLTDAHEDWYLELAFTLRPIITMVKSPALKLYVKTPDPRAAPVDLGAFDVSSSGTPASIEGARCLTS